MLKDKISKEDFVKYIEKSKEVEKFVQKIYESSERTIDIINLEMILTEPLRIIERNFFTDIELDYISWFLYEYTEGRMQVYKAGTNREVILAVINTVDDLWDWLNKEEK